MRTPARRLGELGVTRRTPIVCVDVFCGVRGAGFHMDKAGRELRCPRCAGPLLRAGTQILRRVDGFRAGLMPPEETQT